MVIDKNFFMNLALQEAWKYQGLTYPNPAVGCCVVGRNSEILAVEAHKKAGSPHAEVEALKIAYYKITSDEAILSLTNSSDIHNYLFANHKNIFHNVTIYTTLEPCSHVGKTPSCAGLICSLGIKKVYVGSRDTNAVASGGNDLLLESGVSVSSGVLQQQCEALLEPFNKWREKNFVFFKWAQRLNGTFDDGEVSSLESRINVHAMRDVCDLLVIGGNTVRLDRPTLDARLVDGKAPDLLIYSREKDLDRSIPLFSVPNRKVYIENNLEKIAQYKNVMIEGALDMYELTKEHVDSYLCYIAPKFGGRAIFTQSKDKFTILNLQQTSQDIMMWLKREV